MTLLELQNILGERIRIAIAPDMSAEDRKRETEISQTISSLAKQKFRAGKKHSISVKIALGKLRGC